MRTYLALSLRARRGGDEGERKKAEQSHPRKTDSANSDTHRLGGRRWRWRSPSLGSVARMTIFGRSAWVAGGRRRRSLVDRNRSRALRRSGMLGSCRKSLKLVHRRRRVSTARRVGNVLHCSR